MRDDGLRIGAGTSVDNRVGACRARGIRVERGCGRLYEKLGFVTEGMERQACKLDGIYDDTVVMALSRTAN